MSDMEETEGNAGRGCAAPGDRHSPALAAPARVDRGGRGRPAPARSRRRRAPEHIDGLPPDDPRVIVHGKRVERMVAALFHARRSSPGAGSSPPTSASGWHYRRQGPALQPAWPDCRWPREAVALGLGVLLWVGDPEPDVEVVEQRHELQSDPEDRLAFEETFKEAPRTASSSSGRRRGGPSMLGTLPLLAAPIVLLRDLGPLPGRKACATRCGAPALAGGPSPDEPAAHPGHVQHAGSMITIVPDGYADDAGRADQGRRRS